MTKILLIDDQEIILHFLKKILCRLPDTEILACQSAVDALKLCELQAWDLIVVDYQMPEMNGLEFVQYCRSMLWGKEIPILMVTASTSKEVKYQLLDLGIVDFLQKPVDPTELIARARNLISLHHLTVALTQHNQKLQSEVKRMTAELIEREKESIMVLAKAAESKDPETGFHLLRMASYSHKIGLEIGLSSLQAEQLFLAAPMHDVGKIGVPDRILLKQGKLESDEWLEMQKHTVYGFEILGNSTTPILNMGGVIALNHHEAWNGDGYPYGIKGEQIPLVARVVAVADIFDALISKRPYKNPWPFDSAVDEIKKLSGIKLDPACVDAFCNSLDSIYQISVKYSEDNNQII